MECPIDLPEKSDLIAQMKRLKDTLEEKNINVWICADDWCNTLEDIKDFVDSGAAHMIQVKAPDLGGLNRTVEAALYCKQHGVRAFVGGTCNGTDQSSRITVHVALAVQARCELLKGSHQILTVLAVNVGLFAQHRRPQQAA